MRGVRADSAAIPNRMVVSSPEREDSQTWIWTERGHRIHTSQLEGEAWPSARSELAYWSVSLHMYAAWGWVSRVGHHVNLCVDLTMHLLQDSPDGGKCALPGLSESKLERLNIV